MAEAGDTSLSALRKKISDYWIEVEEEHLNNVRRIRRRHASRVSAYQRRRTIIIFQFIALLLSLSCCLFGATFRRHFEGTREDRMFMKMKMGREMALNKIALPITTLNSALRFASSVKRTAFYCVQCEKNRIVECALLRILC